MQIQMGYTKCVNIDDQCKKPITSMSKLRERKRLTFIKHLWKIKIMNNQIE